MKYIVFLFSVRSLVVCAATKRKSNFMAFVFPPHSHTRCLCVCVCKWSTVKLCLSGTKRKAMNGVRSESDLGQLEISESDGYLSFYFGLLVIASKLAENTLNIMWANYHRKYKQMCTMALEHMAKANHTHTGEQETENEPSDYKIYYIRYGIACMYSRYFS